MSTSADVMKAAFPFRWWEFTWYLIILIFGTVGNVLVILVILLNKKIDAKSSFNILIIVLAITDLLVSVVGLPIYYLSTSAYNHPHGQHGDFLCMFFTGYFLPFFLLDVSVFILVLIALGRRRAITNPLSILDDEQTWKKILPILVAVVLSLGLGLPTIFGLKYTHQNPMVGNHCTYRYTFINAIIIYCVVFLIDTISPIVVLVICFCHIRKSFNLTNKLLTISNATKLRGNDVALQKKQKSIGTMKLVVVAFFLCILPNHLLYLMSLAGVQGLGWNTEISQVGVLIRFTNSCLNPLLYSLKSEKFRKNFRDTFPRYFKGRPKKLKFKQHGNIKGGGHIIIVNADVTTTTTSRPI